MRSREERLRLHALHKAAATALEASLKSEAIDEYEEHHSAATWRFGEDQEDLVVASVEHSHAEAADQEAMLDFLEQHTALTIRREVREVNQDALKTWLGELEPMVWQPEQQCDHPEGDCDEGSWRPATAKERREPGATFDCRDAHGRMVPGVRWVAGGKLATVAIRLSNPTKRLAGTLAKQYADGDLDWTNLEKLHEAMEINQ
jgi:hypothetical protein